jgi:flavin-dependent thymidylate synthase
MGEQSFEDIMNQSYDYKLDQVKYVKDTIKSSWEFVDYVFEICDVSRAFTHQLVRTRNASYAQQTQRAVDVSSMGMLGLPDEKYSKKLNHDYGIYIRDAKSSYMALLEDGMERQDARNVLPNATLTNIIMKVNLRELHEMAEVRLCTRTQGEYQGVFRAMKEEVMRVHPWAEDMIQVFCANHGTCCFPRYTECPIQKFTYGGERSELHKERLALIKWKHETNRFVANPVAVGGRTDVKD